jgi:ferredoxin
MAAAEVFFFTGTGNSLAVARDIARRLDATLTPIPAVVNQGVIECDAEVVGIVFPIYYETHGGIPLIIRRFIARLADLGSKYVFGVTTYGSASTIALGRLARLIEARGGRLRGRFAVNMPENIYPLLAANRHEKMYEVWKQNVEKLCRFVEERRAARLHTPNVVVGRAYVLLSFLGRLLLPAWRRATIRQLQRGAGSRLHSYDDLLPLMDNSFAVGEDCNGCGTCARICPVGNIRLVAERPVWQHRCEFCLACFHWCPREAITSSVLDSPVKYHHPEVGLNDMLHARSVRRSVRRRG